MVRTGVQTADKVSTVRFERDHKEVGIAVSGGGAGSRSTCVVFPLASISLSGLERNSLELRLDPF